jgi:molybdopterin/thiamine biosynthesis adenylyltransferase
MSSATASTNSPLTEADRSRFSRLMQAFPFREGGFDKWLKTPLVVIGAGMLGSRLCEEAVLAGASVIVFDPDIGEFSNLGNQRCQPGVFKALSLQARCDAIRPGQLTAICCDVRHANLRLLRDCAVWFDTTDDANLAWPLTEASNGLATYLLRCAVDGTGHSEMGRVLCSAGGRGHACQCCTLSMPDLLRQRRRTPCLAASAADGQPTLAGGAIATGTVGLALSLAQRLVAGKDVDAIVNHEFILDWTNFQMFAMRVDRCEGCLTGHRTWDLLDLEFSAADGTLADVFAAAGGSPQIDLEPYLHPLNVQAACPCGAVVSAVGTAWAEPPLCESCRSRLSWLPEIQIDRITRLQAESRGIQDVPLAQLGIPAGGMFVARSPGRPTRRLLLR